MSFVGADLQATCERYDPTYPTELASISCGPEDLPFQYTLFGSQADMVAAYNGDLDLGETPPQPDGACAEANFEGPYKIDGENAGRVHCRQHHSSSTGALFHVMEWTNDQLLVIGYLSNREDLHTWEELIAFWQEDSGPFAP